MALDQWIRDDQSLTYTPGIASDDDTLSPVHHDYSRECEPHCWPGRIPPAPPLPGRPLITTRPSLPNHWDFDNNGT